MSSQAPRNLTQHYIRQHPEKHKNTEVYESVLAQLNGRYKAVHGKEFPYKVDQMSRRHYLVLTLKFAIISRKKKVNPN